MVGCCPCYYHALTQRLRHIESLDEPDSVGAGCTNEATLTLTLYAACLAILSQIASTVFVPITQLAIRSVNDTKHILQFHKIFCKFPRKALQS